MTRTWALLALACAPRSSAPTVAVQDGLYADEAIEMARTAMGELAFRGILYPPTDSSPEGAYGRLDSRSPVTRLVDGEWHVAFPFYCPDDPTRGRVFWVDDSGRASLTQTAVMLPSFEPIPILDASPPEPDAEHPEAIGLWSDGSDQFFYDGRSVRVALLTLHFGEWAPEDGVFRLASEWSGDVLRIRFPSGQFEDFARFHDGHFENDGARYAHARPPFDLESGLLPYVRPRPMHDYRLRTGPLIVDCIGDRCAARGVRASCEVRAP